MKDDFQNKIVHFQMLEANLKALQQKAEEANQRIEETHATRSAIEDLRNVKPSQALIPLGSGNFVMGRVENSEDIVVGIGSGVAIKKTRDEAIEALDATMKELEHALEDMKSQIMGTALQMERLQEDLEKMQK
jgi:prefoldin alpha subunit